MNKKYIKQINFGKHLTYFVHCVISVTYHWYKPNQVDLLTMNSITMMEFLNLPSTFKGGTCFLSIKSRISCTYVLRTLLRSILRIKNRYASTLLRTLRRFSGKGRKRARIRSKLHHLLVSLLYYVIIIYIISNDIDLAYVRYCVTPT